MPGTGIIPMGQNVHSNAKHFYCSWHATHAKPLFASYRFNREGIKDIPEASSTALGSFHYILLFLVLKQNFN